MPMLTLTLDDTGAAFAGRIQRAEQIADILEELAERLRATQPHGLTEWPLLDTYGNRAGAVDLTPLPIRRADVAPSERDEFDGEPCAECGAPFDTEEHDLWTNDPDEYDAGPFYCSPPCARRARVLTLDPTR